LTGRLDVAFAQAAQDDIARILDHSVEQFGLPARRRYEILLETAIEDLGADPARPGSRERPELGAGIRTYHLRHSRGRARSRGGRVGKPRHFIAYTLADATHVLILRLLHDAMEPSLHLAATDDGGD
jgi:toxin ParE1/3/4